MTREQIENALKKKPVPASYDLRFDELLTLIDLVEERANQSTDNIVLVGLQDQSKDGSLFDMVWHAIDIAYDLGFYRGGNHAKRHQTKRRA